MKQNNRKFQQGKKSWKKKAFEEDENNVVTTNATEKSQTTVAIDLLLLYILQGTQLNHLTGFPKSVFWFLNNYFWKSYENNYYSVSSMISFMIHKKFSFPKNSRKQFIFRGEKKTEFDLRVLFSILLSLKASIRIWNGEINSYF